jgi:hypothetical protein
VIQLSMERTALARSIPLFADGGIFIPSSLSTA